jgi:hypothetical protein
VSCKILVARVACAYASVSPSTFMLIHTLKILIIAGSSSSDGNGDNERYI